MLYGKDFLKQLDYQQEKDIYIRLTALTLDDFPIERIEGRSSGGSVNVDGASAVRRTCSLTMIGQLTDTMITDAYWSFNNKFALEIGVKNFVNPQYPDIIWFKMGVYIIASFNYSRSTNNLSISISGKDKMCRLNGEVSGNIPIKTDFGTMEQRDKDGNIEIIKLPLDQIIRNAVKEYAQERDENIIINDLAEYGYELWEYRGDSPMYLFISEQKQAINLTFNGSIEVEFDNKKCKLEEIDKNGGKYYSFNTLRSEYNDDATKIKYGDKFVYVVKVIYGETAGYHRTYLYFNNDLIINAGETVTSLLDKIKNMLGNFEYFYDLEGRFVFQRKNTYVQEIFSPKDGELVTPTMTTSPYEYKFEDEKLFTSISTPPNLSNLKNDFAVWGTRKNAAGTSLPIHTRYAIHKKPKKYVSIDGIEYIASQECDWRELIYQMATDYLKYNQEADYLVKLEELNPQFINGRTGYEQYYSDMNEHWRKLYILNEEGKYDWTEQVYTEPDGLSFWFDFLDTNGDLKEYSIDKIGSRTKIVNDNAVTSIYFKETPEVLFIIPPLENMNNEDTAYIPIQIQDSMRELFYKSAQGQSAIGKTNDLIYQHAAVTESISVTSIPIYYLQPNTRFYVKDKGDYTLDRISYSLSYNGTMQLSGTKILKQIY